MGVRTPFISLKKPNLPFRKSKTNPMEERVFQKVRDILSEKKGVSRDSISLDSSFEELELDSLDAVELIADLEDAFGVNVPNTDLQQVRTIRDAVEGLGKALGAKG